MGAATAAGSVRHALGAATDALRAVGVDDARLDAELLLAEALRTDRAWLAAEPEAPVPADAGRAFGQMVRRRLRREPVAYILGRKGFRDLELAVDRRVLIPRPETELLVELALEIEPATVIDVGTGSGAVALAIASELSQAAVLATDTSAAALEVGRANAAQLGLAERVEFLEGMLPEQGTYDLVVANLPYVSEAEWPRLAPEIRDWEPRQALLAGAEGLDAIERLLQQLGGDRAGSTDTVALEVGQGQAERVGGLLGIAGFAEFEIRPDLAGIERVVVGRR
jgi:release factor glutamine methyltransferase